MDGFLEKCVDYLQREDVQKRARFIFKPFVDILVLELYPYILFSVLFIGVSFFLILAIFMILLYT